MQFSDSSSSSGAPTPVRRLQKALPQNLTAKTDGAAEGLDSTVRAFTVTASQDSPQNRERPSTDGNRDDDAASGVRAASLQIHLSAGAVGSPMTTATRARMARLPDSESDDDDDDQDDDGEQIRMIAGKLGARQPLRSVPTSQTAPPFFSQTAAPTPAASATAGRSNLKAFRPVQSSSSSSAASLSLELPGVGALGAAPQRAASSSLSAAGSSRATSPDLRAGPRRQFHSPSSSSSSSISELAFRKLAVPQALKQAAEPVSQQGPVVEDAVAASQPGESTQSIAAEVAAGGAASHGSAQAMPRLVTPTTDAASAGTPPRLREFSGPHRFDEGVAARGDEGDDGDDDEDDEEELDSSAASLAAQAALDAAEQRALSVVSPAVSATALHSLSVPPSLAAASLVPQSLQSTTEMSIPGAGATIRPESEAGEGDELTLESMPSCPRHPAQDSTAVAEGVGEAGTAAAAKEGVAGGRGGAGPRRQPPPPPPFVASASASATQPSHSVMRPDDDEDDDESEESSDGGSRTALRSRLSHSNTELTIEQQNAPATVGTFTHATSLERAQAAVGHSTSLLPPTRSSSTTSSSSSSSSSGGKGRHSGADTPVLSPPLKVMDRSGTIETDEAGTLRSIKTLGNISAPAVGEESMLMAAKQHHFAHLPSMHGDTHGETQTAALATTATTGEGSLSRLSGVLMPPSPSQPRAMLSPHESSLSSGSSDEEGQRPEAREAPAVAARGARGAAAALGAMRMAPVPSSSSSSSSSAGSSLEALRAHLGKDQGGSSSSSSSSSSGRDVHNTAGDGRGGKEGVADTLGMRGNGVQRIRAMPRFSSDDDDGHDDGEEEAVGPVDEGSAHDPQHLEERANRRAGGAPPHSSSSSISASSAPPLHSEPQQEQPNAAEHPFTPESEYAERVVAEPQPGPETHSVDVAGGDDGWFDEEDEADEESAWRERTGNLDGDAADSPTALQEAGRWDEVLGSMDLVDCTLVSRVYQQTLRRSSHDSAAEGEEGGGDLCLFKVLSLFPVAAADARARWSRRTEVQRRLLELAQDMRDTQRALDEAGLTAAAAEPSDSASHAGGSEGSRATRTTCAGITAVYVDANCRLIAQLEAEPYMVPLRHLVSATCGYGLEESEVVALLRSVASKAAAMHNAGFVHGALHANNVLLSSYDGDTVLTQPCGLMSQSATLPSDLSVISVARACSMASALPKVWGARRLHVQTPTSQRLGAPSRPELNELITYNNLAALGWDKKKVEYSDDEDEESRRFSRGGGPAYVPTPVDDLYALGMLAFFLYTGIPAFHTASLWAAVERLGVLAGDYEAALTESRQKARSLVAAFCFGEGSADGSQSRAETLTCGYGTLQRRAVGRLRPEFEAALQRFIVDCVEASCMEAVRDGAELDALDGDGGSSGECHYRTAQDLLDAHALFTRGVKGERTAEEMEEDDDQMRDTVHRVAYPAFCSWSRVRRDCGSAPHLARLHSNALYSARCTALYDSLAAAATADGVADSPQSVLCALCPEVAGNLRSWQPPRCPSAREGGSCGAASELTARRAVSAAARGPGCSALLQPAAPAAPAWLTNSRDGDDDDGSSFADGEAAEAALAAQVLQVPPSDSSDFIHDLHIHALVLADKRCATYGLSRSLVLSYVLGVADTLVLRHLEECTVTLLAPFRYVVLDDVVRCEIRLGPCELCVLRHVDSCRLIAVAAHELAGTRVTDSHISWSMQGGEQPPAFAESHNVDFSLYGLAYSGVAEDYRRVGLSLEHRASLHTTHDAGDGDARRDGGPVSATRARAVELLATTSAFPAHNESGLCLTPEAPYAHAMLAAGTRYVHRGTVRVPAVERPEDERRKLRRIDGEEASVPGDVFHYFGELEEKDVLVSDVHGERHRPHSGTPHAEPGGAAQRPVVFLHGVLGDVTVRRCSFCTVVVAGTASSLQLVDCHNCQLVCMAREAVMEGCAQVDCVALVTEYLLVKLCAEVRVRPLFLDCPYSDEVLRQVVRGSLGGEEEDTILSAYEEGRLDVLNAVLRGEGHGVTVEASTGVVVEDVRYYAEGGDGSGAGGERWLSVFTVPYHAVYCGQRAAGLDGQPYAESSDVMAEAAQMLADELAVPAYAEVLQRYEDASDVVASPPRDAEPAVVVFHDLLDCAILRLRGSLAPVRSAAEVEAEVSGRDVDGAAPLCEVCIERVQFGVLYIEDAVSTLRLRRCVGPLDVVVCAATTVVMEECVNVQLRVACVDFTASDCVGCHVALHVCHRPRYHRCSSMETSVLNITARDYDSMLAAAFVDVSENAFDQPLLLNDGQTLHGAATAGAAEGSAARTAADSVCGDSAAATADAIALLGALQSESESPGGAIVSPEHVPLIMTLLRQPVTVVSPLPGLCVSPQTAPFLEELEGRVTLWGEGQRAPARRAAVAVAALRALADVSAAHPDQLEWSPAAAAEDAVDASSGAAVEEGDGGSTAVVLDAVSSSGGGGEEEDDQVEEEGGEEENSVASEVAREPGTDEPIVEEPPSDASPLSDTAAADDQADAAGEEEEEEEEAELIVPVTAAAAAAESDDDRPQVLHLDTLATVAMNVPLPDSEEVEEPVVVVSTAFAEEAEAEDVAPLSEPEPPLHEETRETVTQTSALADTPSAAESSPSVASPSPRDAAAVTAAAGEEGEAEEDYVPPAAPRHHHGPAVSRYVDANAMQLLSAAHTSAPTLVDSSPEPHYAQPLPSVSPVNTSLAPSATTRTRTSELGDLDSLATLRGTTATIAAPLLGSSIDSSGGLPPMAPGPAHALAATDVGASAAMDMFHGADHTAAAVAALPRDHGRHVAPVRGVAELEDGPVRMGDSYTDPQPTPAMESPAGFAAARWAGQGRLPPHEAPLTATVNSFPRNSSGDWVHSPTVGTPGSSERDAAVPQPAATNATALAARHPAAFVTVAAAAAEEEEEEEEGVPIALGGTPQLRQRGECTGVGFSRETSSSVSDYPHRGALVCDDSAQRGAVADGDDEGRRRARAVRQVTNYLHFSEDSLPRRVENSLPPSHQGLAENSPMVSPGGQSAAPAAAAADAALLHGVDAGVRQLLRQVQEARQRFERRRYHCHQQQEEESAHAAASDGLEARVKSAVAKLKAMKARGEVV